MARSGGHWMDQAEWELWKPAEGRSAGPAQAKGPTPARLAASLLAASRIGDRVGAKMALDQGADPNARTKTSEGETAFTLAVRNGHDEVALDLLRAGGWPSPSRWDKAACEAFGKGLAEGFGEQAKARMGEEAVRLFATHAGSWGSVRRAAELCGSVATGGELAGVAMAAGRVDLALEAAKAGDMLSEAGWDALGRMAGLSERGLAENARRQQALALLEVPGAVDAAGPSAAAGLFLGALRGGDFELARALMDARMRPGEDWTVEGRVDWRLQRVAPKEDHRYRSSFAWAAAKGDSPDFWAFAKGCAPAMAAARTRREGPWSMAEASVTRVVELMEAGVPIDGTDSQGRSLAHVWALSDSRPRDGWATLARKAPEVFSALDREGRTGADLMAGKLQGDEKDRFLRDVSRIEGREIRREAPARKASKASSGRARL